MALENRLKTAFGESLSTIGDIADVICGPFGSAIKSEDYQEDGIPLLRITNITPQGYLDYSNLTYISEELGNSLFRTQVSPGDIVISQRGTLGQCAVVDDKFEKLNISANIIAVKNFRGISAKFVRSYILSSIGRKQLERFSSGQVQGKITTQDIADILIPAVCGNEQRLVQIIEDGYISYLEKLRQANELLAGLESGLICLFGLTQSLNKKLCFSIRFGDLDGVIAVNRYKNIKKSGHSLKIEDICEIVEEKTKATKYGQQLINWIRIDDLPNRPMEIETVRTQPANKVEGSFFNVQKGDILVARLGPTILNQKIVLVRHLERETVASSEFLVLRCKEDYNPEVVMAILKTSYYRNLLYSYDRGSTPSRYRLNRDDMLKLTFPDIRAKQSTVLRRIHTVQSKVKKLQEEAEKEWTAAKERFEKELLEG